MTKPLIIIQARVESTRFPSKVLAPLLGQPLILWTLHRLSLVDTPHDTVVATPNTPANVPLRDLCERHGHRCLLVESNADDVLTRYYMTANIHARHDTDLIVRITGDCPLISPQVIDGMLAFYQAGAPVGHIGIAQEWGDGFDAECLTYTELQRAHQYAHALSDREHVSTWTHRNAHCITYPCPFDLSWLRLSVDTEADLATVELVLKHALARGYSLATLEWYDLMHLCQHGAIRDRMRARPINAAYVAQVAAERGEAPQSWEQLRYGGREP